MDIKSYILNKLFFPKAVTINEPGLILTKIVRKDNSSLLIGRLAYLFEDVLVDLQKKTVEQIGLAKTDEIWYQIGKDLITSYFLTLKVKKPPKFFLDSVVKYMLQRFSVTGITIGNEIDFDKNCLDLQLKGSNNVLHRKSKQGAVLGGIASGVLSFLSGENVEAETNSYEKDGEVFCEIKCSKKYFLRYVPDFLEIKECVKNYQFDFKDAEKKLKIYENRFSCLNQFLRFKKARMKDNIVYFLGFALMAGEINTSDHIWRNYEKAGLTDLISKTLVSSSEKVLKQIFRDNKLDQRGIRDKVKFLQNMMAGFGWGIPLYRKTKNEIVFDFVYGAQVKTNSFLFYALQLQGFLNFIFKKKVKLVKIEKVKAKTVISRVVYKI
ncbi:hypothetical protein GOV14_05350 [Candidatus Pacearchaeota archaeon]|nr:hypothetical protein [Candidatus Pacearchaeota archaeon]